MDSLGEGYGLEDLQAVFSGKKAHTPRKKTVTQAESPKVNLLVDIQAKLQAGKGAGYAQWAKVFNLKQMAQTMNYLSEIAVLRTHIVNYAKTREVYAAYRKAGCSKKFREEHEKEILLHQAAKNAFDEMGVKKLLKVKELQTEYAKLLEEKKKTTSSGKLVLEREGNSLDKKLVLYAVLSAMLISGCYQAGDRLTDEETGGDPIPKETSISGPEEEITIGESENIFEADQMEEESLTDQAILNNTHNIYRGYIGDTEIRMKISRQDDLLTAAFITRADEEWDFEGEIVNDAEFELRNVNVDFMDGAVKEQDGFIVLSGNGAISGRETVFSMTEETYMPIGEDFDNYYSGGIGGCPEEIEAFARKIKDSVNNKEKFIKLFEYPITIYINGEPIPIQGEEEMGIQYDWLITEDTFRKSIENMFTKYLFKNYLGVCVEYGIIWFNDNRITSLNFHSY